MEESRHSVHESVVTIAVVLLLAGIIIKILFF
jgi:hypothetical protein